MELRRLLEKDDRTSFSCGDAALDEFFRARAGQGQFTHRSLVTYVLADEGSIVGFVTVLPGSVRRDDLGAGGRRLPPSALPVLLLARMGVRVDLQGRGLGHDLLFQVFTLALELSRSVGCVGVIVDAKEGARAFYERYDFQWVSAEPLAGAARGFLPIRTLEAAAG